MNEQQLLEKYRGIIQYQATIPFESVDSLLKSTVSLLDLAYHPEEDQQVRKTATTNPHHPVVYYIKSKPDPRVLILIEYYGTSFCDIIIRFPEKWKDTINELLQQLDMKDYRDCLIQKSKMNRMVENYQLDIDIVDEYNLWETIFQQKQFWYEYALFARDQISFTDERIYPELVKPIVLEITPNTKFLLYIEETLLQSSLFLDHPSLPEPYLLGWDDTAGWHPHVLRWEEFEDIFLYLTICYPDRFVVPFLLMARFAPVTKEDNEKKISRMLKAALRSLHLFTEKEIEKLNPLVAYKPHFSWTYSSEKAVYHACNSPNDIYSTRHICTDQFPFQALQDVLRTIAIHKHTAQWLEAEEKWNILVQTYSQIEDEDWLKRI